MPKYTRRPTELRTRLCTDDLLKFRQIAAARRLTLAQLLRDAALDYLRRIEQNELNDVESIYSQQLRASTNRVCSLLAKVGIDAHATLLFLAELEDSAESVANCRARAAKKIHAALTPDEKNAADAIKRNLQQQNE